MNDYTQLAEKREIYWNELNNLSFQMDKAANPEEFTRLLNFYNLVKAALKKVNLLISSL